MFFKEISPDDNCISPLHAISESSLSRTCQRRGDERLEGRHGISVWIEWDTLGYGYVDCIQTELNNRGIEANVILSASGHPAIRLDQGNMKSEDFSALVSALQHLIPSITPEMPFYFHNQRNWQY